METTEGRLSVDEFLKLVIGIRDLLLGTKLSTEDQAKVDAVFAKLTANDSAVAVALSENQPVQEGGK